MCIRDRYPTIVDPQEKGPQWWEEGKAEADIKMISELGMNCLLYTSDAADERSSVDLGGRRIIKKKKREK